MDYLLSFGLGLLSSLHCLGMCGGFAASAFVGSAAATIAGSAGRGRGAAGLPAAPGATNPALALAPYHVGRLAVYAARGALMGAVGSFITVAGRLAGWQGLAASLAGLLMLAWAAAYLRGRNLFLPVGFGLRSRLPRRGVLRAAGLGALLGFMPCGLLATMEIKAAGMGGAGSGLLVMLAFGAGTVPGLTAWGSAAAAGLGRRRLRLERLVAAWVGGAGLLSLLRGLAEAGLIPHANPWLW